LIGECGTGKTHLATGLCLSACRQKRRVRFTTAAALVNELIEAKQNNQVRRMMARWQKYELIALDEVGYVPLADIGAEFLFQVISDRAERAALIVTTNLPFSEWTTVFPNRDCVRRYWTGLQIGHTSSKRGPNHSASGERWKGGRSGEQWSRQVLTTPSSVSPKTAPPCGRRQASLPPGRSKPIPGRMRQNVSIQVGQI
jgi:hypothetical protein